MRRAWAKLADLAGFLADLLVKYVPDVKPVTFDAQRRAEWHAMVEAASGP